MKAKFLLVIVVLFGVIALNNDLKAQDNKENVLTLSITNLALVTPTLYYERVIGDKTSLQLGAYYTGAKSSGVKFGGLGIIPEFRFYPGGKGAPRGFYLAPFLKYQNYSISTTVDDLVVGTYDAKATLTAIGGGLIIGNQFIIGDVVALDLFIGPSIANWSAKYKDNSTESDFGDVSMINFEGTGVGVRLGISLGFAF
jgi:hypothetical protein